MKNSNNLKKEWIKPGVSSLQINETLNNGLFNGNGNGFGHCKHDPNGNGNGHFKYDDMCS